jgi:hypothetical protein
VENEMAVENRTEASLLQLQTAHQKTQEITQIDMEEQRNGAGEVEVGVLMEDSAPTLADTDYLNVSKPTIAKRPKYLNVERKEPGIRNRSRNGVRAMLTQE